MYQWYADNSFSIALSITSELIGFGYILITRPNHSLRPPGQKVLQKFCMSRRLNKDTKYFGCLPRFAENTLSPLSFNLSLVFTVMFLLVGTILEVKVNASWKAAEIIKSFAAER